MAQAFRMLLAVDLSQNGAGVLLQAQKLATRLDATVILVHAFREPPSIPSMAATVSEGPYVPFLEAEAEMQREEVEVLTQQWANRLRSEMLTVEVVARQGPPADVILEAAEEHDAHLIVMGRHGMGRVRRFFTGSVTRAIVEHSTRPVTIIPIND